MTVSALGENLAFLFGVPRFGTTLVAATLNNHPEVLCPPEPWVMFAVDGFAHVDRAHVANHHLVAEAFQKFAGSDVVNIKRQIAAEIYNFNGGDKRIFIDKTPRYYHSVVSIMELFPQAKYIWLRRNLLDVAASFRNTWHLDLPKLIAEDADDPFVFDILLGSRLISQHSDRGNAQWLEVDYREFVLEPQREFDRICTFLGIGSRPVDFQLTDEYRSDKRLGDMKICDASQPHIRSLDSWRTTFTHEEARRLFQAIGPDIMLRMGNLECIKEFGSEQDEWGRERREIAARNCRVRTTESNLSPVNISKDQSEKGGADKIFSNLPGTDIKQDCRVEVALALDKKLLVDSSVREVSLVMSASQSNMAIDVQCGLSADRNQLSCESQENGASLKPHLSDSKSEVIGISIIIPSFNNGRYIKQAIDSILVQRYPDVEIIVMDGGSTDDTVNILHSYGQRIKWQNGNNGGQSYALKNGFEHATKRWLTWLNADDVQEGNALQIVSSAIHSHPETDVLIGGGYYMDERGVRTRAYPTIHFIESRQIEHLIWQFGYMAQPSVYFSKQLYEEVKGVDPALSYCLGYDLWCRFALKRAHFGFLSGELSGNRWNDATMTVSQTLQLHAEVVHTQIKYWRKVSPYFVQSISDNLYLVLHSRILGDSHHLIIRTLYFKSCWIWFNFRRPIYCAWGLLFTNIAETDPVKSDEVGTLKLVNQLLWSIIRSMKNKCKNILNGPS